MSEPVKWTDYAIAQDGSCKMCGAPLVNEGWCMGIYYSRKDHFMQEHGYSNDDARWLAMFSEEPHEITFEI